MHVSGWRRSSYLDTGIINTYYTLHSDPSQDLEKQLGALSCSASQSLLSNGFHIRRDKFDKGKSSRIIFVPDVLCLASGL